MSLEKQLTGKKFNCSRLTQAKISLEYEVPVAKKEYQHRENFYIEGKMS